MLITERMTVIKAVLCTISFCRCLRYYNFSLPSFVIINITFMKRRKKIIALNIINNSRGS